MIIQINFLRRRRSFWQLPEEFSLGCAMVEGEGIEQVMGRVVKVLD